MEEFRNIKGYEGYKISNLGNIKSLKSKKERILNPGVDSTGYLTVALCKESKPKTFKVHQLVATAFLNHTPCGHKLVVNHIDFNKTNNNVNNLEIVTQRKNTNKKHLNSSSEYTGVCWSKPANKWQANIRVNGKLKHLGLFVDELDASKAYQIALNNIK
tara:strand:+ start:105 stop:581 length:477 start_codon:yes stop_codon:yes gene_type:complete